MLCCSWLFLAAIKSLKWIAKTFRSRPYIVDEIGPQMDDRKAFLKTQCLYDGGLPKPDGGGGRSFSCRAPLWFIMIRIVFYLSCHDWDKVGICKYVRMPTRGIFDSSVQRLA